jgi:retinol dehydrogenase-12
MALSFSDFMYTQLILKIPIPTQSFASKTVIITGGNTGLGFEAAKHIVAQHASKVILACRNSSSGIAAKDQIESSTKCSKNIVEVWELDLESAKSIKAFAESAKGLERVDVLLNNAGVMALNYQSVEGLERCVAINVVGTFLLTFLVLPKLEETRRKFNTDTYLTTVCSALAAAAK